MNDPLLLLNEALTKHQAGDLDGAIAAYRAVLALQPQHQDALHMLGVAALQKGNAQLALDLIEAALAVRADLPFGWHNRSLALRALNRNEEALQSAEQAVAVDPKHAEAWNMLGILAREANDFERACTSHIHAVELQPQDAKFQSEYALSLYSRGDLQSAYLAMREALRHDKNLLPLTLANILKSAGDPEQAVVYYRRSRELLPANAGIAASEAMALLQIGEFEQGWALWEKRPDSDTRFHPIPMWQGQPVGHLLLHEDQGLGDTLHFLRYVPWLRSRAARITLYIAPALQRVCAAAFPYVSVTTMDTPLPTVDARVRLASLPFWSKTQLDNIPATIPYLHIKNEWRSLWRDGLKVLPHPRVGLVWAGNPNNRNDHNRSVGFARMAPVLKAGATFVSVQKGAVDLPVNMLDSGPLLDDFATTAGLLSELDLLITVDTAVAHLAGAMGKPVWLLVAFESDWRWMLGREDSPWYPTMRIFRQAVPGAWEPVIERVTEELKKYVAGDNEILKPARWSNVPLRKNPHAVELKDS